MIEGIQLVEKFYYLKKTVKNKTKKADGKEVVHVGTHRCGIVYLIRHGDVIARGVSLCNEVDPFLRDEGFIYDKKLDKMRKFIGGLEVARGRASKALKLSNSSGKIRRSEAFEKVKDTGILFKSELNPNLSPFEAKLLSEENETANSG